MNPLVEHSSLGDELGEEVEIEMQPSQPVDSMDDESAQLSDSEQQSLLTESRPKSFLCGDQSEFQSRAVHIGREAPRNGSFAGNVIRNQKYSLLSFVPVVLYEQFRFFFNMYFLVVALSQFIPAFQVGYLFTYVAPLVFVLGVTMLKEAYDDFQRYKRDRQANSTRYDRLREDGTVESKKSSALKVGDLIVLHSNERVPADCLLLRTADDSGSVFVRTDQRFSRRSEPRLAGLLAAGQAPKKDIYDFAGTFTGVEGSGPIERSDPTVGQVLAVVIYTGVETRATMNTSVPESKIGLLDLEINRCSKMLCVFLLLITLLLILGKGFDHNWWLYMVRFMLLFSSIIPISLRINLDMAKTYYSWLISRDEEIEGTIVRNSTIPEELGRVSYLFSDKTGTLTRNEMIFRKLHLGVTLFSADSLHEVAERLKVVYTAGADGQPMGVGVAGSTFEDHAVYEMARAIALCHNVTPSVDEEGNVEFQAASPDEVALVKFAESIGLGLSARSLTTMELTNPLGEREAFEILYTFPFTSESKRMGIILQLLSSKEYMFYLKGADTVMADCIVPSEWLEEEVLNLAREGLRTLVVAQKPLSTEEYDQWKRHYEEARCSVGDRAGAVAVAMKRLESDMCLLGVTGVEDALQDQVKSGLETLRNGGIKVWMLTGDKMETASTIARSSKLVSRTHSLQTIKASSVAQVTESMSELRKRLLSTCPVIDGSSLAVVLNSESCREEFVRLAMQCPAVVCCRCSPTQKAQVVELVRQASGMRCCAIGDGGNDVSMIQAADVGIGIVGKEGMQASLASDFSILQFKCIVRLLQWHGRNSYRRSASLAQFIFHRGLVISVIQAVFSALYYFSAIPIYNGWLMVGYSTWYTMLPVFSLVLDQDVRDDIALQYPELYLELQKGRALNMRTFLLWCFQSVYQGGVIMLMSVVLFEESFLNIVSITFTALVLTELMMVAIEIHTWHWMMFLAEGLSIALYVVSVFVLTTYFDITYIFTWNFLARVCLITLVSCFPVALAKFLQRKLNPPVYEKLH